VPDAGIALVVEKNERRHAANTSSRRAIGVQAGDRGTLHVTLLDTERLIAMIDLEHARSLPLSQRLGRLSTSSSAGETRIGDRRRVRAVLDRVRNSRSREWPTARN
jgi:hypothetical protein